MQIFIDGILEESVVLLPMPPRMIWLVGWVLVLGVFFGRWEIGIGNCPRVPEDSVFYN